MIVQRIVVKVKPGCTRALVDFLKASRAHMKDPKKMRILQPVITASHNTVVYELTHASLEENRQEWQEWLARPETPALLERWDQLAQDWSDEYWEIEI